MTNRIGAQFGSGSSMAHASRWNRVADSRLVSECSPAELIEAAIAGLAKLGWGTGRWEITLGIENGHLLRARVPTLVVDGRVSWATVGRQRLAVRESEG